MRLQRCRQAAALVFWIGSAAMVSLVWIGHAQQPAGGAGDDPRFTGRSTSLEPTGLTVGRRQFEAGARSAWHRHPNGQLLFVEQGRARTQTRGQPMREMGPGESDYTPPNVEHWHGATPDAVYTQVHVGFGEGITWLEKVTDEEYAGRGPAAGEARLFELRTYTAHPGKLEALHARFRNHTTALFEKHGMTNIGYWVPADTPGTLVYILAYRDRESREGAWKAFRADPEWVAARTASEVDGPLTAKVESVFLTPTDYSRIR